MEIQEAMNTEVLTVTPERTLSEAAHSMAERNCGSAVVVDPEAPGPGIVTERDLLRSVAAGQDPGREKVADHVTGEGTFAAPDWSLERAAEAMLKGSFRHLVVMDGSEPVGVISMRDIVRCWRDRR